MRFAVNTLSAVPGVVGGGETYLANLVRGMSRRLRDGERLTVIASRANECLFPDLGPRADRVVLPLPGRLRPLRLVLEHFGLPPLLRLLGTDVLLSPGNAVPVFAGVRHVLALQSMHYRFVPDEMSPLRVRYFETMVPVSACRAFRTICMSKDLRKSLAEVAPRAARRAVVVYEGADMGEFAPGGERGAAGGSAGGYLLYVSSLNRFKRPDSVVRALAALRAEGFEPPLLRLVGRPDPADRARVEGLARECGVEDLVRIVGVVPHEALRGEYSGASMLIYPSAVETFGLPPLEAMACGCPVVASNRTSVPEVVGDAAVVVDPDDVRALAGAIRRVLTDAALRERLRERGFTNLRRFSWERAAEETLQVMREAGRSELL